MSVKFGLKRVGGRVLSKKYLKKKTRPWLMFESQIRDSVWADNNEVQASPIYEFRL